MLAGEHGPNLGSNHGKCPGLAKFAHTAAGAVIVQLLAGLTVPRSPISPAGTNGRCPLRLSSSAPVTMDTDEGHAQWPIPSR